MLSLLCGLIFLFWLIHALDFIWGVVFRMPALKKGQPFKLSPPLPRISIIFAARDEAGKIKEALGSMLAQDYPDFEVIAVNDRSTDATRSILESFQESPSRLKRLHLNHLPEGWLGKNHALYEGFLVSSGDWILFTDADVIFAPETLSSAARFVQSNHLDHLVLFPEIAAKGFWEKIFIQAFSLVFFRRYRPWAARDVKSKAFMGVGAFNFVRRGAYQKIGTHEALKMEVLDDIGLGHLLKEKDFRQMAAFGPELCSVRWVEGLNGVMKSIEKNAFAGLGFRLWFLGLITAAVILLDVLPFFLWIVPGPVQMFSAASLALIFLVYLASIKANPYSVLTFPIHPAGMLFLLAVIWRATLRVIRSGGIQWRGTFYPLSKLSRRM